MLISAAIIVKNEEDIMERCLACVSLFADEIVVVDTGSTDKTKEIAAQHPKVKLYESERYTAETHFSDFSFSLAKNEAIEKCTGKWVIWWDADDFIEPENADKIIKIAREHEGPCLFSFNIKYGPMSFEHCRMFRSGYGIKFDENHAVHEYLNTLGHPNHSRHDVVIQHIPGQKHMPSGERNIAIMEKDYYERGMDDPRTLFYLANGYREAGRFDNAIEFYGKYLEKSHWGEERFFARYYRAQSYVHLENFTEARNEALKSIAEDFRFAETYCMLGDLAFRNGDVKRAQLWYMMATETPYPSDAKLFVTPALYKEYPMSRIKECHEKLINIKKPKGDLPSGVAGQFTISDDLDEGLSAIGALGSIAKHKSVSFEVSTQNEKLMKVVSEMDTLELSASLGAVSLILPPSLNGRPREEWYCRAAGYVFDDWKPIVEMAQKIATSARSIVNAD